MLTRRLLVGIVFTIVMILGAACSSAPVDTSKALSRSVIESGGVVPAEELRVAEYLAYYKQNFPAPTDSTLGLDLRLGNSQVPVDGGAAWLQVGVRAKDAVSDVVAPLNLSMVIDRSGSMESPEKMPLLKKSLKTFLKSLAANDLVSLVAFNERAEMISPATRVGDGGWIDSAVDRIQPGGNTNLNDGLMMGFREVERNYDVRRNNRVILLTDGIANTGETDPGKIAAAARAYNDKGIYLSTIGLGKDFNDALLSKLADQGKGAYHFVDSAAEIDRVFRQDVEGLFQKAASDVTVVIRPEPGVTVEALTGYDGKPPAGAIQVKLRDMGTGDTQVVLARLNVAGAPSGRRGIAAVDLRYTDLFSNRDGSASKTIAAEASRMSSYDPTWDVEVLRNVTIQRTAEGLKEIDRLYKGQQYLAAWRLANGLEQDLRSVARVSGDQQLVKDADTMRKYEDTLSKWVQRQTGRSPEQERDQVVQPSRGRDAVPTPDSAPIEIR